MFICSFAFGELAEINFVLQHVFCILLGSFACPKETNQRKRQPQIFFGLNILSVAHALQLVVLRPPQTVMLTFSHRFATSKRLIYFQKRFVWHCSPYGDLFKNVPLYKNLNSSIGFRMASENFGKKRLF
jgi:hypothetical protein